MKTNIGAEIDIQQVRREQLKPNDKLFVKTINSEYKIEVIDHARFSISGGWFDKRGISPFYGSIEGVTWGWGDLISDIVVQTGMRIKFKDGPTTSHVKSIIYEA